MHKLETELLKHVKGGVGGGTSNLPHDPKSIGIIDISTLPKEKKSKSLSNGA
ncbi:hypothetical protein [Pseudoalteromonas rubra]|uniref:hypothetical protein n=1 Tax=Pseudoalteromonas rubra TaxID=43658 RepID=UPI0013DDFB6A|nr:hypothetical protein [Pseudoalteromonas rubra]